MLHLFSRRATVARVIAIAWTATVSVAAAQPAGTTKEMPAGTSMAPAQSSVTHTHDAAWTARDWATVIAALGGPLGLIGALVAVWVGQRNTRATIAAAWRTAEAASIQKANESELASIERILDAFYGPFLQISEANALVYGELRARQPDPTEFMLLTAMVDAAWRNALETTDRALIEEIVRNDTALEALVREKAGLVEAKLMPYLARASAHYRMLQLAHLGSLAGDADRVARYRYPWQLDHVLNAEVARLQRRCETLRRAPAIAPGPMEALVVEANLRLDEWPMPLRPGQPQGGPGSPGRPSVPDALPT